MPTEESNESHPLRKIADAELKKILREHVKWLDSKGESGNMADFYRADLRGTNVFINANLSNANLFEADLSGVRLNRANLSEADLSYAKLIGASLPGATLSGALFIEAYLDKAYLSGANLSRADLNGARLVEAILSRADFSGAILSEADLSKAKFLRANLSGADLSLANFTGANLSEANLTGAIFRESNLTDCRFDFAKVDGSTLIQCCKVSRQTNFTGVGLDSARVDPKLKPLLKYNVRRLGWQEWYKDHHLLKWPVFFFWLLSNYGISIKRIIGIFFSIAAFFALIYFFSGLWCQQGLINNLFKCGEPSSLYQYLVIFFRALYFSVVTMTTLGFGDIHANPNSIPGLILVILQVCLGYLILAALVTSLGILFTSDGPAGRFEESVENKLKTRLIGRFKKVAKEIHKTGLGKWYEKLIEKIRATGLGRWLEKRIEDIRKTRAKPEDTV